MHTELTFSMLSVRVAEIRSRWLDNQSHFTNALSLVEDNFNLWLEVFAGIQNYNEYLTKLHLGIHALGRHYANAHRPGKDLCQECLCHDRGMRVSCG